jgi:hypothetical protein
MNDQPATETVNPDTIVAPPAAPAKPDPAPCFVAQTLKSKLESDAHSIDQAIAAWCEARWATAKAEGATFFRFSHDDKLAEGDTVYLIEAWTTRPDDQGEPRFGALDK